MMRKNDQNLIKTFLLALVIVGFAGLASAAWNQPSDNPPLGNTPAPINTTTTNQVKQGGLRVGNGTCPGGEGTLEVCGSLKTSGLANEGNIIIQGTDEFSTLDVGWVDSAFTSPDSNLILNGSLKNGYSLAAQASVDIDGTAKIEKFASANQAPGTVYPARLCADEDGVFNLCQNLFEVSAEFVNSYDAQPANNCNYDAIIAAYPNTSGKSPFTYSWTLTGDTSGNSIIGTSSASSVIVRVERDTFPITNYSVSVSVTDDNGYTRSDTYTGTVTGLVTYDTEC